MDSLHVHHSLRATVSQEDRDSQRFQAPPVRRAKSNDNTSTARPPSRVRTGVREPPVNKRRNPERASETFQNLGPPSKEFGEPPIFRSHVCQVPRLIMSSMTQDVIQRQTRELPTDVLQRTPGLPRKSLCMPVNARQVEQDYLDRDLRRRMALDII